MKNKLLKTILNVVVFLFSIYSFSQQDAVSGTLTDDSGLPLPGVNVIVKGTQKGTQTDFDGNYTINCDVGNVLVFNFVGMKTKEVTVNASMLLYDNNSYIIERMAVDPVYSNAYAEAIKIIQKSEVSVPSIEDSKHTVNMKDFDYSRIRNVDIQNDHIRLTYFKPDVFFEIGYTNATSLQFIKNKNLPELQKTYAQGAPQNGELAFLGAETGNLFSYGPKLNNLEFDGSNYDFDINGRLVSRGNGNGILAAPYDNDLFRTTTKILNHVFFNITTDVDFFGVDFTNEINQDFYGRENTNSNQVSVNYRKSNKKLNWNAFIKYGNELDNQPNINGFHNNLLLNLWATPASFSNSQGATLSNSTPRSFSPNLYNNPEWLLNYNINSEKHSLWIASLQNEFELSDDITLQSNLNYNWRDTKQTFGLPTNTVGFENGYKSSKNIKKDNFNAVLNFNYKKLWDTSKLEINSINNFNSEHLDYELSEASGFEIFSFEDPQNNFSREKKLAKNTWRILNKAEYELDNVGINVSAGNNSYISSIQNNKWFLPTLQLKLNLDKIFHLDNISNFTIFTTTSYDVNDSPLFYSNQSHNSLMMHPSESWGYTTNADLFLNNRIALEDKQSLEFGTAVDFYLLSTYFEFDFTYFDTKTKGSVFPVFENDGFELQNVANISNRGFEINFSARKYTSNYFQFIPSLHFSTYRNEVTQLLNERSRVSIAGFSTISKNLIVGQPAGVIVSSAYARDSLNNVIIDSEGFPIVADEHKIIGDPTPDFNIGFTNEFRWKKLALNFVIDFQKGGDVWNGTQNVLNYFGTSQQSAEQRTITDYIFSGVDQQGNVNTIPVDFANPENGLEGNRFVRYGFEGVAEDAIEDGSYINLKSIALSYTLKERNSGTFFRDVNVSLYANNLFTWSKYRGASPYSSLYDTSSGAGLNFFNSPIATEVGLKINLKI
ncbi:MAG: carboxypeptidase-like regulatory domain-containing protein [Aquaticitalea sp.]